MCDTMSDHLYKTIKKTGEEITKFLKLQKKPKTNIIDLFKSEQMLEK